MDETQGNASGGSNRPNREDRLDSWKKIASYLKRDVSTVQRWERREGLPVHRHLHDKQGSVFAFRTELDVWWESRRSRLTQADTAEGAPALEPVIPAAEAPRVRPGSAPATGGCYLACGGGRGGRARMGHHALRAPWRNPLDEARFTRLADFPGFEQSAAISRDGRLIAFLGTGRAHGRLDNHPGYWPLPQPHAAGKPLKWSTLSARSGVCARRVARLDLDTRIGWLATR